MEITLGRLIKGSNMALADIVFMSIGSMKESGPMAGRMDMVG